MKSMCAFIMGWAMGFAAESPNRAWGAGAALCGLLALIVWNQIDRKESRAATQIAEE